MTRVLVTGATGRIGAPLVTDLLQRGHAVRALCIPGDGRADGLAAQGAEVVVGSVDNTAACDRAVDGVQAIFHLAAQLPQNTTDGAIFEANVRGTWNLLAAASPYASAFQVVVLASTDDVYSSVDALYVPVDENHPRRPVSTYGLSKVIGEEIGRFHYVRGSLPVAIARFGLTQRADELLDGLTAPYFLLSARVRNLRRRATSDPAAAQQLPALERVLDSKGEHAISLQSEDGLPWILQVCEVSDLVGGLTLYLDRPAAIGESYNMGGPAPFASDVAARHLASLTGLEVLDVIVPGPRVVISESIQKARMMLGYNPHLGIAEILERAVAVVGIDRIRGGLTTGE